jgi:hypothetical protein
MAFPCPISRVVVSAEISPLFNEFGSTGNVFAVIVYFWAIADAATDLHKSFEARTLDF